MKYMGSKARHAKELLPIILKDRKPGQWYVEPFVGGANMIDKVDGPRIGADAHPDLIAMWKGFQDGSLTPVTVDKDQYQSFRNLPSSAMRGWVGFNCSYSGKFFGGFAGKTNTKIGTVRDYQAEAIQNIKKQIPKILDVLFILNKYQNLEIPANSIIYCDPPYLSTTSYSASIDHNHFWQWCRDKVAEGHQVFVSEYTAPDDWQCVWQKKASSSLSANGKSGGNKESVERLFTLKNPPSSPDFA